MNLTTKETNILIKSLEFISYFSQSLNTTPQEYIKRLISIVKKIAEIHKV